MDIVYVALDTETGGFSGPLTDETGARRLGSRYYPMLQIALKVIDSSGRLLAEYSRYIQPTEQQIQRCSVDTMDFHKKNGFLDIWSRSSKVDIRTAEEEIIDVLTDVMKNNFPDFLVDGKIPPYQYDNEVKLMLLGKSIHFDKSFLESHCHQLSTLFSHQLADITAMRTHMYRTKHFPNHIINEPVAHEAMADVDRAIDEAKVISDFLALAKEAMFQEDSIKFSDLKDMVAAYRHKKSLDGS